MTKVQQEKLLIRCINEVDNARDDMELAYIRAGKALWDLHGPKGAKKAQLWKIDPEANGLARFTDYCARKWPTVSTRHIYEWMEAYETASAVFGKADCAIAQSPSESVLRPMTALKTDAEKQKAWKLANENKKGERITALDTAEAVRTVKMTTAIANQEDKQMAKEIGQELKSEKELQQYAEEGISTKDAFIKVHNNWQALIKGEDDERAINKLANVYVEYLSGKYSIED